MRVEAAIREPSGQGSGGTSSSACQHLVRTRSWYSAGWKRSERRLMGRKLKSKLAKTTERVSAVDRDFVLPE
jgi:hypothetical protein